MCMLTITWVLLLVCNTGTCSKLGTAHQQAGVMGVWKTKGESGTGWVVAGRRGWAGETRRVNVR